MTKFIVPEIQTDFGEVSLYDYQVDSITKAINHCRESTEPAYISASVSSGKSLMIAAIAKHFQRVNEAALAQGFKANHQVLMLVRTGDLVKQNADEAWSIRCKNSIWCAGLGMKSKTYPCVMGSEKSVFNALHKQLKDFKPTILMIDECLTGDSLIDTDSGKVRIDDVDLINRKIKCINERTGDISFDKPVRVFSNGTKRVSHIYLSNGERLTCTNTHKLYSNGSWVRAKYLKSGSRITLIASGDTFMTKLLRASVAVVRELTLIATEWICRKL